MASIKISDLRPVGSELFQDSESFLNELSAQETLIISGGEVVSVITTGAVMTTITQAGITITGMASKYVPLATAQSQ